MQYGHGTGEARDSTGEADNGGDIGTLPELHGASRCASATRSSPTSTASRRPTIYATDNGVDVVQEALGTLNNVHARAHAVEYAYDHGVTVIASAADEAAQHHNWPVDLPHVIIVNSVTKYDDTFTPAAALLPAVQRLHELLVARSRSRSRASSCSSDATGRGAGMAGSSTARR